MVGVRPVIAGPRLVPAVAYGTRVVSGASGSIRVRTSQPAAVTTRATRTANATAGRGAGIGVPAASDGPRSTDGAGACRGQGTDTTDDARLRGVSGATTSAAVDLVVTAADAVATGTLTVVARTGPRGLSAVATGSAVDRRTCATGAEVDHNARPTTAAAGLLEGCNGVGLMVRRTVAAGAWAGAPTAATAIATTAGNRALVASPATSTGGLCAMNWPGLNHAAMAVVTAASVKSNAAGSAWSFDRIGSAADRRNVTGIGEPSGGSRVVGATIPKGNGPVVEAGSAVDLSSVTGVGGSGTACRICAIAATAGDGAPISTGPDMTRAAGALGDGASSAARASSTSGSRTGGGAAVGCLMITDGGAAVGQLGAWTAVDGALGLSAEATTVPVDLANTTCGDAATDDTGVRVVMTQPDGGTPPPALLLGRISPR